MIEVNDIMLYTDLIKKESYRVKVLSLGRKQMTAEVQRLATLESFHCPVSDLTSIEL